MPPKHNPEKMPGQMQLELQSRTLEPVSIDADQARANEVRADQEERIDNLLNQGFNLTEARMMTIGTAVMSQAEAVEPKPPRHTTPRHPVKDRRGRNNDGSVDRRTLRGRARVTAAQEQPRTWQEQ